MAITRVPIKVHTDDNSVTTLQIRIGKIANGWVVKCTPNAHYYFSTLGEAANVVANSMLDMEKEGAFTDGPPQPQRQKEE